MLILEPKCTAVWNKVQTEHGPAGVGEGCPLCGTVAGLVEREAGQRELPPDSQGSGGGEGSGPVFSALHIPLESSGSPWGRRVELTQFNRLLA